MNGRHVIIGLYVDDLLYVGKEEDVKNEINELNKKYTIRIMNPVNEFVGCQLQHNKNSIVLNQQKKIDKLQEKYDEELNHLRH